jgi:phosphate-selective porin OprO/OprP
MRIAGAATILSIVLFGQAAAAAAQTSGAISWISSDRGPARENASQQPPPSAYDRIWKLAELYHDDSNRVVQRIRFTGRYQQDFAAVSADQGAESEWNVRRLRLGLRATMFRDLTVHGEVDLNPQEADPFYERLTDLYLKWSPRDQLALTVGKQGVSFTADGSTSSKELLALDRSNLTNNIWFTEEYLPGVSVSGNLERWIYQVGVYSAGEGNREFGEFTGGLVTLGTVGFDFAEPARATEALLTLNYVYQSPDPDNTFTRPLQHIVSAHFRFDAGRWGFRSDVSAGAGYYDQSDVLGVMVMPFVNAWKTLQFVGRYTYVESRDANGIELGTYEDRVVSGRGNRYNDVYFGANYYFYGHQLKLQSGVQFGDMNDAAADGGTYSGVSWTTGVRVAW